MNEEKNLQNTIELFVFYSFFFKKKKKSVTKNILYFLYTIFCERLRGQFYFD